MNPDPNVRSELGQNRTDLSLLRSIWLCKPWARLVSNQRPLACERSVQSKRGLLGANRPPRTNGLDKPYCGLVPEPRASQQTPALVPVKRPDVRAQFGGRAARPNQPLEGKEGV